MFKQESIMVGAEHTEDTNSTSDAEDGVVCKRCEDCVAVNRTKGSALQRENAMPARDIRASMSVFSGILDYWITEITGKPLTSRPPRIVLSPSWYLAACFLRLLGSVALSITLLLAGWPFLLFLPLVWMATVSGARLLQVTIIHHCVHANFTGNKKFDFWLAELISVLLFIQDAGSYSYDHVTIHHSRKLATLDDPDLQFLILLGIQPGMSVAQLWRQLLKNLFSPRFHFLFLRARVRANLFVPTRLRKLLTITYLFTTLSAVAILNAWWVFLVAWVLPLTIFYHMSALLQFVCEHQWLLVRPVGESGRVYLARLTIGRFMGEMTPVPNLVGWHWITAWTKWIMRMLLIHVPARFFVIVGDLPQHDWHHRHPKDRRWTTAAYTRQADLEAGTPGWPSYAEVWGLVPAIDSVFTVLSQLPPLSEDSQPLSLEDASDILMGM